MRIGKRGMRMGHIRKKAVNISLAPSTVERARRYGLNISDIAESAITAEIERRHREDLQARMDREMEWWNEFSRDHLTPTDEFGTL